VGEEFIKSGKAYEYINNSGEQIAKIHYNIKVKQANKQPV